MNQSVREEIVVYEIQAKIFLPDMVTLSYPRFLPFHLGLACKMMTAQNNHLESKCLTDAAMAIATSIPLACIFHSPAKTGESKRRI